jgi:hypothetical protein
MAARAVALALAIAANVPGYRHDTGAARPVFVVVVGHGAIRVRLAAGAPVPTIPCDSSENRMIFDGWLGVGRYLWATGVDRVCYEHTRGALRESDWSPSYVVPTITRKGPAEIQISTD